MTCVACNNKYRTSTYDDSYEEIIDKDKEKDKGTEKISLPDNEPNPNLSFNLNKSQSNIKTIIVESQDQGSEYLLPMFDLSDAPILDFSNSFSSNSNSDPSSLISKVRNHSILSYAIINYLHMLFLFITFFMALITLM